MTDVKTWKDRVEAELPRVRRNIEHATSWLTANPETGGSERLTADFLSQQFGSIGFNVERRVVDLPTAFTASLASDVPGPQLGLIVVYDAVPAIDERGNPQPNHSCGHLVVAAAAIGVSMIWQALRSESKGTLTVVGSPADEHATGLSRTAGGGKAALESAGVFKGLHAVLYAHPEDRNTVWRETQWMARLRGTIIGERSDRSGMPKLLAHVAEMAAELEGSGNGATIALEHAETSGDSASGARIAINADLVVRAATEEQLNRSLQRVVGSQKVMTWEEVARYVGIVPHKSLITTVENVFHELGLLYDESPPPAPYATDFGSVSTTRPAALIGIGSRPWAFHSDEGSSQFLQDAVPEAVELTRVISVLVPVLMESIDLWP